MDKEKLKDYVKPKADVVRLRNCVSLLAGSGETTGEDPVDGGEV